MPNMSYCRFENTANDLQDCWDNFDDGELNDYEQRGRRKIIRLACEIAQSYGEEIGKQVDIEQAGQGENV